MLGACPPRPGGLGDEGNQGVKRAEHGRIRSGSVREGRSIKDEGLSREGPSAPLALHSNR